MQQIYCKYVYLWDENCMQKNDGDNINLVYVLCAVCTLNKLYSSGQV